jgi:homoprotocatechuate degradation regulator HpaR
MASEFKHLHLPLLMLQARERVISYFRPLLHAHDVTEQQWRVIRALSDAEPLEPHEISELSGLSSPSLAGVLSRMEEVNLVSRKRVTQDQRRVKVSLTPYSRAMAAKMAPQIDAVYARVEELLGKHYCDRLYSGLDAVLNRLPPQRGLQDGSPPVSKVVRRKTGST